MLSFGLRGPAFQGKAPGWYLRQGAAQRRVPVPPPEQVRVQAQGASVRRLEALLAFEGLAQQIAVHEETGDGFLSLFKEET